MCTVKFESFNLNVPDSVIMKSETLRNLRSHSPNLVMDTDFSEEYGRIFEVVVNVYSKNIEANPTAKRLEVPLQSQRSCVFDAIPKFTFPQPETDWRQKQTPEKQCDRGRLICDTRTVLNKKFDIEGNGAREKMMKVCQAIDLVADFLGLDIFKNYIDFMITGSFRPVLFVAEKKYKGSWVYMEDTIKNRWGITDVWMTNFGHSAYTNPMYRTWSMYVTMELDFGDFWNLGAYICKNITSTACMIVDKGWFDDASRQKLKRLGLYDS